MAHGSGSHRSLHSDHKGYKLSAVKSIPNSKKQNYENEISNNNWKDENNVNVIVPKGVYSQYLNLSGLLKIGYRINDQCSDGKQEED